MSITAASIRTHRVAVSTTTPHSGAAPRAACVHASNFFLPIATVQVSRARKRRYSSVRVFPVTASYKSAVPSARTTSNIVSERPLTRFSSISITVWPRLFSKESSRLTLRFSRRRAQRSWSAAGAGWAPLTQRLRHFPDFAHRPPIAIGHRDAQESLDICSQLRSAYPLRGV